MKKQSNINIPEISVSELTELLSELYIKAIDGAGDLKLLPTPFIWGAAGVGKSQGVRQIAVNIEKATGKKVYVTDVRLLLFSPVDLRGVPVADAERKFTNWLRPAIFNMIDDSNAINILFLDELSAAPQSVQAAAYQICLDRKIGEHRLPDNCIVIAAGNRTTDKSVAYAMPKALCNRQMHFSVCADYASWRRWAVENEIHSSIIAYLAFDSSRLCTEPEASDYAYPTPRSWAFASQLLKTMDSGPESIHTLISACIGSDTAIEFEAFCKTHGDLPDIEQIIEGRCKTYPKSADVLFALVSGMTETVYRRRKNISQQETDNVCEYASRFPSDFAAMFFKDLNNIKELKPKLMKSYEFQSWLTKHKFSL